jgi:riboflavin biosynthesis pyrimidine reductase
MFDLPVLISESKNGFRIAVAINDDSVISRKLSRADLEQLRVRIDAALGVEATVFDDWLDVDS